MDDTVREVVGIEVGEVSGALELKSSNVGRLDSRARAMPTTTMNADADHRAAEATSGLLTIG
ncbi:MAG: hypothetical protein J0H94_10225 [Rhizobiales bacterium]|nr:hypothetical protein [Hyphomicrobiales bacterium]